MRCLLNDVVDLLIALLLRFIYPIRTPPLVTDYLTFCTDVTLALEPRVYYGAFTFPLPAHYRCTLWTAPTRCPTFTYAIPCRIYSTLTPHAVRLFFYPTLLLVFTLAPCPTPYDVVRLPQRTTRLAVVPGYRCYLWFIGCPDSRLLITACPHTAV